jgi:hypothetical protein
MAYQIFVIWNYVADRETKLGFLKSRAFWEWLHFGIIIVG